MRVTKSLVVAGVVLLAGAAVQTTAVSAAPRNSDAMPVVRDRDSGPRIEPVYRDNAPREDQTNREGQLRTEQGQGAGGLRPEPTYRDNPPPPAPVYRDSGARPEPAYREGGSPPEPATYRDGNNPGDECPTCPPPRKYDSQEVIKTTRDVDKSRVINTTTVVPVAPKYREHNHLIVHENQTRLTGTVQHNNLIIEKEIRYVRRRPVYSYPRVHVVKRYRVVPQYVYVPVVPQQSGCGCNPPPPPVSCCSTGVRIGAAYDYGYYGY